MEMKGLVLSGGRFEKCDLFGAVVDEGLCLVVNEKAHGFLEHLQDVHRLEKVVRHVVVEGVFAEDVDGQNIVAGRFVDAEVLAEKTVAVNFAVDGVLFKDTRYRHCSKQGIFDADVVRGVKDLLVAVLQVGRDELEGDLGLVHLLLFEDAFKDGGDLVVVDHRIAVERELQPIEDTGKTLDLPKDLFLFHTDGHTGPDNAAHAGTDDLFGHQMFAFKVMQHTEMGDTQGAAAGEDKGEVFCFEVFSHGVLYCKDVTT